MGPGGTIHIQGGLVINSEGVTFLASKYARAHERESERTARLGLTVYRGALACARVCVCVCILGLRCAQ
jgi:hypothetical protein